MWTRNSVFKNLFKEVSIVNIFLVRMEDDGNNLTYNYLIRKEIILHFIDTYYFIHKYTLGWLELFCRKKYE